MEKGGERQLNLGTENPQQSPPKPDGKYKFNESF